MVMGYVADDFGAIRTMLIYTNRLSSQYLSIAYCREAREKLWFLAVLVSIKGGIATNSNRDSSWDGSVRVNIAKKFSYFSWMSRHSCDSGLCRWQTVASHRPPLASSSSARRCWSVHCTVCHQSLHSRCRLSNSRLHDFLRATPTSKSQIY